MPILPSGFAALALAAGIQTDTTHYLFMQTGASGYLDLFVQYATGASRVFSLNPKGIYNGSGTPTGTLGASGEYYVDDYNHFWYGPKPTHTSWGTGFSLIGPTGATGATGSTGPSGASGQGVPIGGDYREMLVKSSGTDYDTEWVPVYSLTGENRRNIHQYTVVFQGNLLDGTGSAITDLGSGVTFCPPRNSIFVVYDGSGSTPRIIEYSLDGRYLREIALSGFYDIEAIDWMVSDPNEDDGESVYFIIAEERLSVAGTTSAISQIVITDATTTVTKGGSGHEVEGILLSLVKNSPNQGIEALAYHPEENVVYFMLEVEPGGNPQLYKTTLGSTSHELVGGTLVTDMNTIKDMCYNPIKNSLIVVGNDGTPTNGLIAEILITEGGFLGTPLELPIALNQVEGVCLSWDDNYLIITGEDSTNGADFVVLQRNRFSNPFLDRSGKMKYFGDSNQHSLVGKKYHSLESETFDEGDSPKSIIPSTYDGSLTFGSGFSDYGNTIKITAYGSISITASTTGTCELQLGLQNYINADPVGGLSSPDVLTLNSGLHNWRYESEISFRTGEYVSCSTFEDYFTNSGTYQKSIQVDSGVKPAVGDFDLVMTSVEGGSATYTYLLDVYHLKIEKS